VIGGGKEEGNDCGKRTGIREKLMEMKLKSRKGEKRKKSGNKQERKSIIEKLLNVETEQD
jgi:hypothetical protein